MKTKFIAKRDTILNLSSDRVLIKAGTVLTSTEVTEAYDKERGNFIGFNVVLEYSNETCLLLSSDFTRNLNTIVTCTNSMDINHQVIYEGLRKLYVESPKLIHHLILAFYNPLDRLPLESIEKKGIPVESLNCRLTGLPLYNSIDPIELTVTAYASVSSTTALCSVALKALVDFVDEGKSRGNLDIIKVSTSAITKRKYTEKSFNHKPKSVRRLTLGDLIGSKPEFKNKVLS